MLNTWYLERRRGRVLATLILLFFMAFEEQAHCASRAENSSSTSDLVQPIPSFAISVVRPARGPEEALSFQITDDGLQARGVTVELLIRFAYGVESDQITGLPRWPTSEAFDVQAKVEAKDISVWKKLSTQQHRESVRGLLADRFEVRLHAWSKVVSVDSLTLFKGSDKTLADHRDIELKSALVPSISVQSNSIHVERISMSAFASILSSQLGKTVVDGTNEPGTFSFTLRWNPEADAGVVDSSGLPGLLTALREQLGIRMISKKNEVQLLEVDSIAKPTQNEGYILDARQTTFVLRV